jgi:hypothetical protein
MSSDDYEHTEDDEATLRLQMFLELEERSVERALPELLEALRSAGLTSLNMVADMLDPAKPGAWKLELRRNIRGKPRADHGGNYSGVSMKYFLLREELEARGARSPDKAAKRELKRRHGWTDTYIRAAIKWWHRDHTPKR